MKLICALLMMLIAAPAAQADCVNQDLVPDGGNLGQVAAAVLCLNNADRARHGLPPLRDNARLARAALGHSADMVARRYFAHTDPDGVTFDDRIDASGYTRFADGWSLGENLAWAGPDFTPSLIEQAWMQSPTHRRNILDRTFRDAGVGVVAGTPPDATSGVTISVEFGAISN
jgi:uncharacterized protein YkwD